VVVSPGQEIVLVVGEVAKENCPLDVDEESGGGIPLRLRGAPYSIEVVQVRVRS
jgi:hypothetical protein